MLIGLAVAAIVLRLAWWLWWWLPKQQVDRLRLTDAQARADVEDNFRKTAGQLLGGAAVLIGAGIAYVQFTQQQETAREQSVEQQRAARDLLISNQVSKGFEQLGSDKVPVRLGGIYALEGMMNTPSNMNQLVPETLCAFVGDETQPKTDKGPLDESRRGGGAKSERPPKSWLMTRVRAQLVDDRRQRLSGGLRDQLVLTILDQCRQQGTRRVFGALASQSKTKQKHNRSLNMARPSIS